MRDKLGNTELSNPAMNPTKQHYEFAVLMNISNATML